MWDSSITEFFKASTSLDASLLDSVGWKQGTAALDINTAVRSRSSERAPFAAPGVREVQGVQAPRSLQRVYRPDLQAVELEAAGPG